MSERSIVKKRMVSGWVFNLNNPPIIQQKTIQFRLAEGEKGKAISLADGEHGIMFEIMLESVLDLIHEDMGETDDIRTEEG